MFIIQFLLTMSATQLNASPQDVRQTILEVALQRFLRFGYRKTTMAEIATDCSMSTANLYRYFENKQEIIAQCAAKCLDDRVDRLRVLTYDEKLRPSEKLRRYALALVDDSHDVADSDSMVGELVDTLTREMPALIHSKNAIHHALLAEILTAGNACGEFAIDDIAACAKDVHSALIFFDVPLFVGLYDRAEFEARARGVVKRLIDGLSVRAPR